MYNYKETKSMAEFVEATMTVQELGSTIFLPFVYVERRWHVNVVSLDEIARQL
jgi:hypothetical protein